MLAEAAGGRKLPSLAVTLALAEQIVSIAFSPDGHTIASGSNDQSVRLWETDADRVAERICAQARPAITEEQWRTYFPDIAFRASCG